MGSFGGWARNSVALRFRFIGSKTTSAYTPWLSFVAFYAVLANIPYWFISHEFGFLQIGWFRIQYLTVGLLALVLPGFLSASLLLVIIFADILCGICLSYYLPIGECLENLSAAHAFSGARIFCVVVALLLVLLVTFTAGSLPGNTLPKSHRLCAAACLLAFAALLVGADVLSKSLIDGRPPAPLNIRSKVDARDLRLSKLPLLVRYPLLRLAKIEIAGAIVRAAGKKNVTSALPVQSATAVGLRTARLLPAETNRESPNLVLIVVESWGLAKASPLNEALIQSYRQPNLLANYDVVQGTVPFDGATIPGESRELCGISFGFHLLDATKAELKACLPAQLVAAGYHSIALHGMSGYMFKRTAWYRTIGFQETWFHDGLKQQGLADCVGAFVGTCDADIAAWIGRRLEEDSPHPYFIHWMTLNSHLPVFVPSPLSHGVPCRTDVSLTPNTPLCSWYQLIANVHQSVSAVAMDKLSRPTVFVIVGDHAPPFADPEMRDRFSQSEVPCVVLLPRPDHSPLRTVLAHNAASPIAAVASRSRQTP